MVPKCPPKPSPFYWSRTMTGSNRTKAETVGRSCCMYPERVSLGLETGLHLLTGCNRRKMTNHKIPISKPPLCAASNISRGNESMVSVEGSPDVHGTGDSRQKIDNIANCCPTIHLSSSVGQVLPKQPSFWECSQSALSSSVDQEGLHGSRLPRPDLLNDGLAPPLIA